MTNLLAGDHRLPTNACSCFEDQLRADRSPCAPAYALAAGSRQRYNHSISTGSQLGYFNLFSVCVRSIGLARRSIYHCIRLSLAAKTTARRRPTRHPCVHTYAGPEMRMLCVMWVRRADILWEPGGPNACVFCRGPRVCMWEAHFGTLRLRQQFSCVS